MLGKTLLLLVERQELLVDLQTMTQRTEETAASHELSIMKPNGMPQQGVC